MKYKIEFIMLFTAVVMFIISALCYSYTADTDSLSITLNLTYPYRAYVFLFISIGTILMGIATISYSRKNKAGSNQQKTLSF